jgi:cytochrome c553
MTVFRHSETETPYHIEVALTRRALMDRSCVRILYIVCLVTFAPKSWSEGQHPATNASPPDWAYPVNPPSLAVPIVSRVEIRVPNSTVRFFQEQLTDLFYAPDWHAADHPAMPDVVARGRKPDVQACGYCHLPDGAGRPENASLAGLPATYIEQQVRDFRSGARRTAVPGRLPPKLMADLAGLVTDAEIATAAEYFSNLKPQYRIKVIETRTVPSTHVAGWILVDDKSAAKEPIGSRIIEVPEDLDQFEHRDSRSNFIAYVPVGAVADGKALVTVGGPLACATCHGLNLKGSGSIPGIAGRSPSYIMRQLFDMQSGVRSGTQVAPMAEVVKRLRTREMLEISAYLATLR